MEIHKILLVPIDFVLNYDDLSRTCMNHCTGWPTTPQEIEGPYCSALQLDNMHQANPIRLMVILKANTLRHNHE